MKTFRKLSFVALGLMTMMTLSFGQKANVKGADKLSRGSKPNYAEARSLIQMALQNEETKEDPNTWYTAGQVEERYFTGENQKSLKGEPQDLASMYKALLDMHDFYMKTYEIDHTPNEEGKVRAKYDKKLIESYENNLLYFINAGGYYLQEVKDNKLALKAFQCFREIKRSPLLQGNKLSAPDSNSMMVDFFAILAAYQAGEKKQAIEFAEELKGVGYRQNEVYQMLSQIYLEEADTAAYISTMKEGLSLFPQEAYYSVNLINIFISQKKYDEARQFLAQAIELNPNNAQLYDVMGKLYEEEKPEEAIKWFEKALTIDANYVDALVDLGRIYYNLAVQVNDDLGVAAAKAKREEYLKKALPYLQKAYELDADKSYYLLGNVYYGLGDNEKYEAIQKAHGL